MSHASSEQAPKRQVSGAASVLRFFRDVLVILLVAFTASFLLKTFLIRSFYIPSGSMEHTLEVSDRILVNQLVPDIVPLKRGDVVVFKDPGGWVGLSNATQNPAPNAFEKLLQMVGLAADTSNDYVVKRVIGLGGDRVQCCDATGRVTVNGVPLDEVYVNLPQDGAPASKDEFDVTVPAGSMWVMGDNRYSSADSRYHQDEPGEGFVPLDDVVGRAFLLNWPFDRFSWLSDYPEVFTGVAEAQQSDAEAE